MSTSEATNTPLTTANAADERAKDTHDDQTAYASGTRPALIHTRVFAPGVTIYHEADRAEYYFQVLSGAVRACKLSADGRRQVIEFYLEGDLFGFDDEDGRHSLSAEVASEQSILLGGHRRRRLDAEADAGPALCGQPCALAFKELLRARARVFVRGSLAALERVAAFLMEMGDRLSPQPGCHGGSDFVMPMGRKDIADYLGITPETLSRCLHKLQKLRVIELVTQRQVRVLDWQALMALDNESFAADATPHRLQPLHLFDVA